MAPWEKKTNEPTKRINSLPPVDLRNNVRQSIDPKLRYVTGNLNAVSFGSKMVGVAVGDQGQIWRTIDAGRNWKYVRSGVNSNLMTVRFIDEKTVVAAGGHSLPVKHLHKGIFLRSTDAGKTWKIKERSYLPRITHLELGRGNRLLASATGELRNLVGVYESHDKGNTWGELHSDLRDINHRWTKENGFHDPKQVLTRSNSMNGSKFETRKSISVNGRYWVATTGTRTIAGKDFSTRPSRFLQNGQIVPAPVLIDISFVRPTECWAIDSEGAPWQSVDRGRAWKKLPVPVAISELKNPQRFRWIHNTSESVFLAARSQPVLARMDKRTGRWTLQRLPFSVPASGMDFADSKVGTVVGPMGSIAATFDGGNTWQLQHQSLKRVAVLVVARNPEDVPIELLTKLSADQGLIVGVLSGEPSSEYYRVKDAFSLQSISAWFQDKTCFDRKTSGSDRTKEFEKWIQQLHPQVVLLCEKGFSGLPELHSTPANTTLDKNSIISACKATTRKMLRQRKPHFSQVQIAQISPGSTGRISFAQTGFSYVLQQTFGGHALTAKQILAPQQFDRTFVESDTKRTLNSVGIRPVASTGAMNMKWFQASSGNKNWENRPVRKHPKTHVGFATTLIQKASWIAFMKKLPSSTERERSDWLRQLRTNSSVPDSIYSKWLMELSSQCRREGKPQIATLAAIEAWDRSTGAEFCLPAILPAIEDLLSEEYQWKQNLEKRRKLEREMALAQKEALEDKNPDAVKNRLYQKYGIDPDQIDRIPPEIHEQIMLLEDALAGDRRALEAYRKSVTVPQPTININSNTIQTDLGQQATELKIDWTRPAGNQRVPTLEEVQEQLFEKINAISGKGIRKEEKTILDRPKIIRSQLALRIVGQIDAEHPQLAGYPRWWLIKSACFHAKGNKDKNLFCHKKLDKLLKTHGYGRNDPNSPMSSSVLSWAFLQQTFSGTDDLDWKLEELSGRKPSKRRPAIVSFSKHGNGISRLDPLETLSSNFTNQPPFLDGRFGETCWKPAMDSQSNALPMSICNDDQYLYLRVRVPSSHNQSVRQVSHTAVGQSIKRDEIRSTDTVSIHLDVDGDHLKGYEIQLDSKGGISEIACGDKNWDPEIFVAKKESESNFDAANSYEIAIRLEDLSSAKNNHPWMISLAQKRGRVLKSHGQWWFQVKEPTYDENDQGTLPSMDLPSMDELSSAIDDALKK